MWLRIFKDEDMQNSILNFCTLACVVHKKNNIFFNITFAHETKCLAFLYDFYSRIKYLSELGRAICDVHKKYAHRNLY